MSQFDPAPGSESEIGGPTKEIETHQKGEPSQEPIPSSVSASVEILCAE